MRDPAVNMQVGKSTGHRAYIRNRFGTGRSAAGGKPV